MEQIDPISPHHPPLRSIFQEHYSQVCIKAATVFCFSLLFLNMSQSRSRSRSPPRKRRRRRSPSKKSTFINLTREQFQFATEKFKVWQDIKPTRKWQRTARSVSEEFNLPSMASESFRNALFAHWVCLLMWFFFYNQPLQFNLTNMLTNFKHMLYN